MMNSHEEQARISLLIGKQLTGTITEEEQQMLDEWRHRNPWNETVYSRLTDIHHLDIERQRAQLTDYTRPLADMKHRLGIHKRTKQTAFLWAAVVLMLLLIGGIATQTILHLHTETPSATAIAMSDIKPGSTQAVLHLGNGKTVTLGTDAQQNSRAIAEASQGEAIAINDLSTPRGGEFRIVLEDGTEVWLNAASHLRYPETFGADERRVEVSGEAYFKVAHDGTRPFYVESGGQQVRVYGTEFNVHSYSDEPATYTTLVEGSISLAPIGGNGSELMLTPGNQAVFTHDDATASIRKVDPEVVTSWRSGTFVFENQTLAQIMHTLSRWYDFEYEFKDASLANTEFMGSIPRYGSFSEVCDIFHKIGGIQLRQEGHKIIISTK